ncbi:MAG TPA: hypothetical protein VLF16_09650 [Pseudomonas sp.]|nr:hypothetical protein [Pseudomonas sp.]
MAADEGRSRTYPVHENMPLQRMAWRMERLGWYCLVLLAVLALAGLFSKGPLSTATVASADNSLRLEYQRFARNGAQSQLMIDARGAGESLDIVLAGELLDGFSIESMQPQPQQSTSHPGNGLRLRMATNEQGQVRVRIQLKAGGVGPFASTLSLADQQVELRQFIYP